MTDITDQKKDSGQINAYARLGQKLNLSRTIVEAGGVIAEAAAELIGGDAALLVMIDQRSGLCRSVLNIELLDGRKAGVVDEFSHRAPTPPMLRTMQHGAEIILRREPDDGGLEALGNRTHCCLSLLYVPIRDGTTPVGMFSIQSYQQNAYGEADLVSLQSLVDYAGGALSRILDREALNESEKRLREAQAISHIGNFHWNAATDRVVWSDELFRIYGREPGQFQPTFESYVSSVHPEDRSPVVEALRAAMTGIPEFSHDNRVVLPDGRVRWVHSRGMAIRGHDGKLRALEGTCQDITERRQAEERTNLTLSLMSATLESTADGILVVNSAGRIETYNRVFAKMWHLPDDILASKDDDRALQCVVDQLSEPDKFLAKVNELYAQPEAESFDSVAFKDGRQFERYSRPQTIHGQVVGRVWSFSDVTEQRRSEAALRENEARFRLLFEGANDAIFWADAESGLLTHCNPAAECLLGRKLAEIIGQPHSSLHPPEDAQRYQELFQAHTVGGGLPVEAEVVRKDGSRVTVSISTSLTSIGNQKVMQGIFRDISERKAAEEELRRTEERFRELAENIQEVFWTTDPKNDSMLYVSPAYERIWGRPCAQLYGEPWTWLEAVHPDDRARVLQAAMTRQASGDYDETYRIRRPDGSERWIRDRAFPIVDNAGKVQRIVGTAADITNQRHLEEQLRESQKMEAIGQLAGGVAHDFNNILCTVLLNTELAGEDESLCEETREGLREIRDAAERASNLTGQLLAFSRRQVMQMQLVDLNDIVIRMTKMLQRVLRESVQLQINLHARTLLTRADPGMLDQVLLNLAVNASDAMPNGGQLLIETGERILSEREASEIQDIKAGRHVWLRVSDTGSGIALENLPRIFEPFFTTKEVGKGTGLGLSTVFGIIKQHGGSLSVESELGRGTRFDIFLRASHEDGPSLEDATAKAKPRLHGGSETILLVEDSPEVRKVSQAVLKRAGYKVLEAADGLEALQIWEQHGAAIQLLLTDMVMPNGLSGQQLAAQLQARAPGLRVIFTSGYSAELAGQDLNLKTGQNFIQKPASMQQLLDIVRQSLDR